MQITIDCDGGLSIVRGKAVVLQYCPFLPENLQYLVRQCGHWCQHFGEPKPAGSLYRLPLCHGRELVGEIEDQRETNDGESRGEE